MVRKILLSLIAVLGLCVYGFAQNRQVSGKVADAEGKPVAGATVMVDGTSTGTTTGTDGKSLHPPTLRWRFRSSVTRPGKWLLPERRMSKS